MSPLVSVILGTYNCELYLREAMESVFNQTYSNYEFIVVDDASTDGTLDILRGYGDRIQLHRRRTNSRTCELPRYQGTSRARGEYCAFLDADDLWEPEKLEKQARFHEAHPEIPLSHTYCHIIDDVGRKKYIRHEGAIASTGWCARDLLEHCSITISSVMVKKEVWLAALPEPVITDFGMDWDFFLTIARSHPIGFLAEPLGRYRQCDSNVGQQKWRRIPRNVNTMERIYRQGLWDGVCTEAGYRRLLVDAYLQNADHHRYAGHPRRSMWFCGRALSHEPWRPAIHLRLGKALISSVAGGARMAGPSDAGHP